MATTMDRFTPSRAPVKRVKAVQFGIWNPEEIVSPVTLHTMLLLLMQPLHTACDACFKVQSTLRTAQ
jgi:hypothetical protein